MIALCGIKSLTVRALQPLDRIVEYRERIAPPYVFRRLFVYRLQAQLDPDRLDTVEFIKERNDLIPQAVRSRRDGEGDDVGIPDRLGIETAQGFDRSIGPGIALIIGDVLLRAFSAHDRFRRLNGLVDISSDRDRKVAAASRAKDTAAAPLCPVPCRAGKAAVKSKLVNLFAEALLHIGVQASVMFHMYSVIL